MSTTNSQRPGSAGMRRAVWALLAALVAAAPVAAQKACDENGGTLGIQGMRCEGCTFTMSRDGITQARFRTEPQVIAVARGFTQGDRLRPGDRIVAIDGDLITTRAGSDRLVNLRAGQEILLRVRRDGHVEELRITAGSACELRRRVDEFEVEVERMAEADLPPGYVGVLPAPPAVEAPPADAPLPPPPAVPAIPAVPPMPPSGYLGFGMKCGPCGVRDGVRYFDENPPVVTHVAEGSPADRAGLEPDDEILAIDGVDILSREGGERFSEIDPGDRVELTVRRGRDRRTVTLVAGERLVRAPSAAMPAPPAPGRWSVRPDTLTFGDQPFTFEHTPLWVRNEQGEVMIILRDAPITIQKDETTGEIVIRSGGRVIRMMGPGG